MSIDKYEIKPAIDNYVSIMTAGERVNIDDLVENLDISKDDLDWVCMEIEAQDELECESLGTYVKKPLNGEEPGFAKDDKKKQRVAM